MTRASRCSFSSICELDPGRMQDHLRGCASCRMAARAWTDLRELRVRERERDDAFVRLASEQRLAAHWPAPRRSPTGAALLAASALLVVVSLLLVKGFAVPSTSPHTAVVGPRDRVPSETATVPGAAPVSAPTPLGCRLEVSAGERLMLDWLLDPSPGDGDGDGDGIEVDGPAVVQEERDTVVLVDGTVRAHAVGTHEIRTSWAVTRGASARWSLRADDGATHVVASEGIVEVTPTARPGGAVRLQAGESIDVRSDGSVSRRAAVPVAESDDMLWRRATAALEGGDRLEAEPLLERLVSSARSNTHRERASYALAELELARGEDERPRARLRALLSSTDRSLAEDAALLLSRTRARGR